MNLKIEEHRLLQKVESIQEDLSRIKENIKKLLKEMDDKMKE